MLRMRVARWVLFWVSLALMGAMVFTGLDQALLTSSGEREAVARDWGDEELPELERNESTLDSRRHEPFIVFDDDDLQVRYGEYSETEISLSFADDFDTRDLAISWGVADSQLPAGMELGGGEWSQIFIYGTPQFVGRWCFTLKAEVITIPPASPFPNRERSRMLYQPSRQVCFYAAGNDNIDYPRFSTSTRLSTAELNDDYSEKIRFQQRNRRVGVSVAWHNLPNSLKIDTRRRRGYVKVSGKPRHRTSHAIINVSKEERPQFAEMRTVADPQSRFRGEQLYAYRITAVYADGEAPAEYLDEDRETPRNWHLTRVDAGESVHTTITYDKRPLYFNVFRTNKRDNWSDVRFITRLKPRPSGAEYVIDTNAAQPRMLPATGLFYLMLKLTSTDEEGEIVSVWKQFSLNIIEERDEVRRYRCPIGYYYDNIVNHCVQNRGNPCSRGSYYDPDYGTCRSYPSVRYCPSGYYFDHFLRRCVLDSYPRCPWHYRWSPLYGRCVENPYWCPLGYSYDWDWRICVSTGYTSCRQGWHYDYGRDRCVRNHRACASGYVWDRETRSCRRNYRNCPQDYHWSERQNRCVYHGTPTCRLGYRYDARRRQCVRIERQRRCPFGEHWSHRRERCMPNNRPDRRGPTTRPDREPSRRPTTRPSRSPSRRPTTRPSRSPSRRPTTRPSRSPSRRPTTRPSRSPSRRPTTRPSRSPSRRPTTRPSRSPSRRPTTRPSRSPSRRPTTRPSRSPSRRPTTRPSRSPSRRPTTRPSRSPSRRPTTRPSRSPSRRPTTRPSRSPSRRPTTRPSREPTVRPSRSPSRRPTARPSRSPSRRPTASPSRSPSRRPTASPSRSPSRRPTTRPSRSPSRRPTTRPSRSPSRRPTASPSRSPSRRPTASPSRSPSRRPTASPSRSSSRRPTARPSRSRRRGITENVSVMLPMLDRR